MQVGNAVRFSGTVELTIHFDGESYGVAFWEADDELRLAPLTGIKLAPGKHFADDGEAFDEVARVALGFAGLDREDLYAYTQLTDEGDECVIWRDRDTAVLMAR